MGILSLKKPTSYTYEGAIASRARLFHQVPDTTNFYLMGRSAHIASENLSAIKVVFGNFYTDGSGHDAGVGAAATITASIEYPAGTFSQIRFSGSVSGTITDVNILFADYTPVSIPAGSTFWIRSFVHCTSGIFYNPWQNTFLGEATAISATAISDQTMGGTITNSGFYSYPPMAILGMTQNPSVVIIGDSAGVGSPGGHDTEDSSNSATGWNAKVGLVARSLGNIPFINICAGAQVAQQWSTYSQARLPLITKGSHLINEMGSNDIGGNMSTAADTTTYLLQMFSYAASFQKKYQCTIKPISTSTDGWTTLANQTVKNSQIVPLNQAIRAGLATGIGGFDVGSVLESSMDSGLWKVTPQVFTDDGVHPTAVGYQLVQDANRISGIIWP